MKQMTFNYGVRFDYFTSAFPDQTLTPATQLVALSVANGGSGITPRDTLQTCATNAGAVRLRQPELEGHLAALRHGVRPAGRRQDRHQVQREQVRGGRDGQRHGRDGQPVSRLINSASRTWTDGSAASRRTTSRSAIRSTSPPTASARPTPGADVNFGTLNAERGDGQLAEDGLGQARLNWEFSAGVQQQVMPRVSVEVVVLPPGLRQLHGRGQPEPGAEQLRPVQRDRAGRLAAGRPERPDDHGLLRREQRVEEPRGQQQHGAGEGSAGQPEPDPALERRGLQRQRAAPERDPAAGRDQHGPHVDEQLRRGGARAGIARQHGAGGLRGDRRSS